MLDFMIEREDVWTKMKKIELPLVLYGMGNGADVILDKMAERGLKVEAVFATDEFVRGQSFRGYKVEKYSDVLERLGDFAIIIAFASERDEVIARFKELAAKHIVLAPHLPLYRNSEYVTAEWLEKNAEKLQYVYDNLADEVSREVFACVLNYKLSGKPEYLWRCETVRRDDIRELFAYDNNSSYLDLGAYDGDTVREFIDITRGEYKSIIAVEPDRRNLKKLQKNMSEEGSRIKLFELATWKERCELQFSDAGGRQSTLVEAKKRIVQADTVDNILGEDVVTYIKIDVEGAEKETLEGAKKHLVKDKPQILMAAYHYDDDMFALPLKLWAINKEYKIYLRKHIYVPAWEINIFAK